MGTGSEHFANTDFAEFDPRTQVPRAWDFRVHDSTTPLRDRWLSHFCIGDEERAGLGVLAPAQTREDGLVGEALGQWLALPPFETQPVLRLGLGLVAPSETPSPYFGDFRVLIESEAGHTRELFWGRLDNSLWRDVVLPLRHFAGQTVRILVENLSEAVLLVDYARVTEPDEPKHRWQLGRLTIELVHSDPFLIDADVILNEIGTDGGGSNRLLSLEGAGWLGELTQRGALPFGEVLETRKPRYLKARRALHLVTLTTHASMRRSILHRAVDDCLRIIRRDAVTSLVAPPLLLGSLDSSEAETFARDWIHQILEWYRTYHPRQLTRIWVPTLFQPLELHDLYSRIFDDALGSATRGATASEPEEIVRLAGMANLVKTALPGGTLSETDLDHIERLLEALTSAAPEFRGTIQRLLAEAGLAEAQMLEALAASYRHSGRLDDVAMASYERLHDLEPGNVENARALASCYRCRFRIDGDRTRMVYEQVFRADPADEENNRFLASQYLLAASRDVSALKGLIFEKVGLGPGGSAAARTRPPGFPDRPLPAATPFVHPDDRPAGEPAPGEPRSEVYEEPPETEPSSPQPAPEAAPPRAGLAPSIPEPSSGLTALLARAAAPEAAAPEATRAPPAPASPAAPAGFFSAPAPASPAPEPALSDTDQLLQRLAAEMQEARRIAGDDPPG